jgi:hypothetical protein
MTWTGMRRRPRRLVVGVVVPLVLAIAAGGTAAFLMRAHANGANAATNTARRMSKDSVSGSLVSAPAFSKVAASGDTVVAVGSQDSAIPSFSVSTDGGRTWTPAFMGSQAGPVTGHPATTGETITGLAKDSWGYLATGTAQSGTGLVWTSPNGLNWHRFTAARFGLVGVPGEQVFAMTDAASDWNVTLIVGFANKGGKTCAYVWRSLDNGAAWRTVVVPQTNGAGWTFAGLAGDAGHFIAVRPGATAGLADAVVYTSDDAVNWHFATTIAGSAGFTPRQVTAGSGGTGRFVVTGRDRQGHVVAYTSTDNGATWAQSEGFGVVPAA